MFPLVGIPKTVAKFLKQYRKVFCREAGFKHVNHYINGLLMSSLLLVRARPWRKLPGLVSPVNDSILAPREALHNLLELSHSLLLQGKSTEQVLEVMMPS